MKNIIVCCLLSLSLSFANNSDNLITQVWQNESHCKIQNKNIEICRIVDGVVKLTDNIKKLQNAKDDTTKKLYEDRIDSNVKKICNAHEKLNTDDREFLEGLKLRYNGEKIYDEAETTEICEKINKK